MTPRLRPEPRSLPQRTAISADAIGVGRGAVTSPPVTATLPTPLLRPRPIDPQPIRSLPPTTRPAIREPRSLPPQTQRRLAESRSLLAPSRPPRPLLVSLPKTTTATIAATPLPKSQSPAANAAAAKVEPSLRTVTYSPHFHRRG